MSPMVTLKVLDLFCGQGGASAGYESAGLASLFGVDSDLETLKRYPYWYDASGWEEGLERYGRMADFIHASPPCQLFSKMKADGMTTARYGAQSAAGIEHLNLIPPVREALLATGKPFVIENV